MSGIEYYFACECGVADVVPPNFSSLASGKTCLVFSHTCFLSLTYPSRPLANTTTRSSIYTGLTKTMGFLDSIQKGAAKTKLQGEIMLLDRDIAAIKKAFGVALYDCLSNATHQNQTPALLKKQPEVATAFEMSYKEIQQLQAEKDAKLQEIEHFEAKSDTRLPATSAKEKYVSREERLIAIVPLL